jgi:hypothetical protein
MKILISIDLNNYDLTEADGSALAADCGEPIWSLFGLKLATFQDWKPAGRTGSWVIDGEVFCGTQYECEVNYHEQLLLRCLIAQIKKTCGDRLMSISIDGQKVEFADDDLMLMRPEWNETMEKNR